MQLNGPYHQITSCPFHTVLPRSIPPYLCGEDVQSLSHMAVVGADAQVALTLVLHQRPVLPTGPVVRVIPALVISAAVIQFASVAES